jgi:hypothetical protein
MDVKMTFLNGNIDETIYMVQAENFVSKDLKNMVCKLTKSIYGLRVNITFPPLKKLGCSHNITNMFRFSLLDHINRVPFPKKMQGMDS